MFKFRNHWVRRALIGLFGATILVGGLSACGHRGDHYGRGMQPMTEQDAAKFKSRMVERVAGKLDLDEAQKARLGIVADKLREQRNAFIGATDPRAEVQALIAGPAFDRAKARSLVDAKAAAVTGKSPEVIAAFGDFYDSLKPEQQQKVREFLSERRGWRRG